MHDSSIALGTSIRWTGSTERRLCVVASIHLGRHSIHQPPRPGKWLLGRRGRSGFQSARSLVPSYQMSTGSDCLGDIPPRTCPVASLRAVRPRGYVVRPDPGWSPIR